ncbi:hypothetical protein [Nocardioides sp. J54]|uniref:hypothetical protein n=1 Tax=Nocardioides sp. J54 TaxID=935866 RepID=UPI000491097E|nr:hypothetical protein [Nocardioides sp. J54]
MKEALEALLPMYLFMLLPIWIPLIAVTFGAVLDVVRPRRSAAPGRRVAGKRARTASYGLATAE